MSFSVFTPIVVEGHEKCRGGLFAFHRDCFSHAPRKVKLLYIPINMNMHTRAHTQV